MTRAVRRDAAVVANNLTRCYRTRDGETIYATDDLSFEIPYRQFFGILGPNGAGKTTVIKMMSTLLSPSSGTLRVNGFDVMNRDRDVRASIGVLLADRRGLYWKLSAIENLKFFATMYGVPGKDIARRIEYLLNMTGLWSRRDDYVETFSTGMMQRLMLCICMVHNPDILILDEPTAGLDVESREALQETVLDLNKLGKTIIYATHNIHEAEQICDVVGIMNHGKFVANASPRKLVSDLGHKVFLVELSDGSVSSVPQMLKMLAIEQPDLRVIRSGNSRRIRLISRSVQGSDIGKLQETLSRAGLQTTSLTERQTSLEDVFIALTKAEFEVTDSKYDLRDAGL